MDWNSTDNKWKDTAMPWNDTSLPWQDANLPWKEGGSAIPAPSLDLIAASDTGDVTTDNITNDTTPDIDIAAGTPWLENDEIDFRVNGVIVDTHVVTAGEVGGDPIALGLSALSEGTHSLTARHRRDGDNSSYSDALVITVDTTAPTLSSPTGASTGETTATISVSTNDDEGVLYYVVDQNTSTPSAAQVKAGQDQGGAAADDADSVAISSTGVKSWNLTGLAPGTTYKPYFMHEDVAGNRSTVATTTAFTTDSAGLTIVPLEVDLITTDATTYTHPISLGTAQAGRVIAGSFFTRSANALTDPTVTLHVPDVATDPTGTAVTLKVPAAQPTLHYMWGFYLQVDAGTAGELQIVHSGAGPVRSVVDVFALYGASSATPTDTDDRVSTAPTRTLTVGDGGLIYCAGITTGAVTSGAWTFDTIAADAEIADADYETTSTHICSAYKSFVTGEDVDCLLTWTGGTPSQSGAIYMAFGAA